MNKNGTAVAASPGALKDALPADVKVIEVPIGADVEVDVDVEQMTTPYAITLNGGVLIKSLVDRRERVAGLSAGTHRLGWTFAHTQKGWKHLLRVSVGGATEIVEERSEQAKDPDHSVGVAFLVVG